MNDSVWIVEERPNPSTDYYLLPAFSSLGHEVIRFAYCDALPANIPLGQVLVFVRYIPGSWVRLVDRFRHQISEIVFFMDDDVLDTAASKGTPLRYRFKLACLGAGRKSWLLRQKAKIWVSTPYLLEKYSAWSAKLVPPSPVSGQPSCTVFYHGSATHDAEIRWLRPIVEEVLKLDERCSFEIVGGMDVYRLYHGLARVRVVHPMKWAAFQKFLALPGRTVGLVPVLDTRFNKARSYTKFFDITRSGAAGIYTRGSIFGSIVNHEVDGLLQENDPEQWIESILDLLADAGLREKMVRNAKRRAEELRLSAQESYTCLC